MRAGEGAEAARARLQKQIWAMEGRSGGAFARDSRPDGDQASTAVTADGAEDGAGDEDERCFRKIASLAARSEQATALLREKLVKAGFAPAVIERAIARACRCGLVDDGRYAEVLARSRLSQGRGRQGIAAELARLGIDADGVEALGDDELPDELDRALAVLDAKPTHAKNPRAAAYRRLVQKGYGADIASSAARQWSESPRGADA